MKKTALALLSAVTAAGAAWAQSPIDAYNLSTGELRGTARFMSMAGAFTALGGDLSTLHQNPAGIGLYRGSEFGITLDLDFTNTKTVTSPMTIKENHTQFDVNNAAYVGTLQLGDRTMPSISWGFSYSRLNSFDRDYQGQGMPLETSLSNYITTFTDGYTPSQLDFSNGKNPYQDWSSNAPYWLSILAYNSGMVNPVTSYDHQGNPVQQDIYNGLWQYQVGDNGNIQIPSTQGTAGMRVRERGYTDEYSFNFGGNIANLVYYGIGIGVVDIDFEQNSYYGEDLTGANVPRKDGIDIEEGNASFVLHNWKKMSGTGVNAKFGVIVKPVNEFRIGLAVHTPTWYDLSTNYWAETSFDYSSGFKGTENTDDDYYDWKLRSPWKLMAGVAGVLAGRAIVSLDYEYQGFKDMNTQDADGYEYTYYNDCINNYFKASNTVRLGLEYRVTPQFSVRAGYSYTDTNVTEGVENNDVDFVTSGCNPSYTLDGKTQYVTFGLGYRYKGFYADLAYVYKNRESTYHAFTSFKDYDGYWTDAPTAKVTDNNSQVVLSLGFKF